jgi:hypothetical protein
MRKGSHTTVTLRIETWKELIRIKYARGFETVDEVIRDLLEDEEVKTLVE